MKRQPMRSIAWMAIVWVLAGCGAEAPETAYRSTRLGVHFDFPAGWRQLEPSKLPPGKESLVTIEDSSRLAQVSLVEFDLQQVMNTLDVQLMLQMAEDDNVQQALALFVQLNSTFEKVFQERYERYELLEQEWVRVLEGQRAVASDLVFEGKLPGEPGLMWRKATIILVVGQEERGFIMAYAVPAPLIDDYRAAFDFVENSWRTSD